MGQPAGIGESIHIKGELTGNEDLVIDGRVDGKISLEGHALTIGASARVAADILSKEVVVIGQVVGNITAVDRIEITSSGSVEGDLRAQRVALADGATFKGTIDMKPGSRSGRPPADPAHPEPRSRA